MVIEFLGWARSVLQDFPMLAPLLFVIIHMVMAILILPCSPLTLMAGALWGGVYGLSLSIVGALASSAATFLLSRSLFHDRIHNFLLRRYPSVTNILARSATHDWKLVAVTQLNPMLPASVMGYVFGLTHLSLARYMLLSAIFMIPLQVLFVYTGHTVATTSSVTDIFILVFLLVFVLAVLSWLSKLAYRKLSKILGK